MTIPSKDKHLTNYNMAASIRSLIARDEVLSFGDPVMGTCCFHTKILISIKIPYLILYRHDDVCYQIITTYVLRIIAEQVRTESLARDLVIGLVCLNSSGPKETKIFQTIRSPNSHF